MEGKLAEKTIYSGLEEGLYGFQCFYNFMNRLGIDLICRQIDPKTEKITMQWGVEETKITCQYIDGHAVVRIEGSKDKLGEIEKKILLEQERRKRMSRTTID